MTRTHTNRSPRGPNMQGIPIRTETGRRVKAALVSHMGEPAPVDYGAVEARIAAWLAV